MVNHLYSLKEKDYNTLNVTVASSMTVDTIETLDKMKKDISLWLDSRHDVKVVFIFNELVELDSTGLGVIIKIYDNIKEKNGQMYYYGANERVESLFQVTTFDTFIKKITSL